MGEQKSMPLVMAKEGEKVKLVQINAGDELKKRLAAMGLVPNSVFKVINNGHPGPFVVEIKRAKVILGRGMAHKIMVEKEI